MSAYKDFVDVLRSRLSIVDIVSKKTKLVKRGHDYFGLCPFHSEKTGSFKVDPARGLYYCFGCGKHGDAFSFVMDSEHLSFTEAVEKLAESVGLPLPKADNFKDKNRFLYAVLERIRSFFEDNLNATKNEEVIDYIKYRGITSDDIRKFHIGFANNTDKLITSLKRDFSTQVLLESGVFYRYGSYLKNKFEGRLIFPIHNPAGKCIGFGGRSLADEMPKYLNSVESDIFKKNQNLYGYDLAKRGKYKDLILVEGYLDVISMHRAGFDRTVAGLGTALGEDQIQLCWKLSDMPIVLLDGDTAGIKAAYRFMLRILPVLEAGKSFKFALIPNAEDPDSIINSGGVEVMNSILDNAIYLQDWLWQASFSLFPAETPEQKSEVIKMLREHIETIQDKTIKLFYRKWLDKQVYNLLFKRKVENTKKSKKISIVLPNSEKNQKILLALIIVCPYILDSIIEELVKIVFDNERLEMIKNEVINEYNEKNNIDAIQKKLYNDGYKFLKSIAGYSNYNFEDKENLSKIVSAWRQVFDGYFVERQIQEECGDSLQKFRKSFSIEDWNKFKSLKEAVFNKSNETE